jgi:hypothetical protein
MGGVLIYIYVYVYEHPIHVHIYGVDGGGRAIWGVDFDLDYD